MVAKGDGIYSKLSEIAYLPSIEIDYDELGDGETTMRKITRKGVNIDKLARQLATQPISKKATYETGNPKEKVWIKKLISSQRQGARTQIRKERTPDKT